MEGSPSTPAEAIAAFRSTMEAYLHTLPAEEMVALGFKLQSGDAKVLIPAFSTVLNGMEAVLKSDPQAAQTLQQFESLDMSAVGFFHTDAGWEFHDPADIG